MKDVSFLASDELKGRKTGSEGNNKAREYIIEQFKEIGLEPIENTFEMPFSIEQKNQSTNGVNIVGRITGKKEEAIIVTAHYDHVGVSKQGEVYNGADDNASGVAGLLALARYFKSSPPDHTFLFVAFDAEEIGLLGAKDFVESLPIAKNLITVNINMDMISRSDKNEIYVAGTHHYPQFKRVIESVAQTAPILLSMGHDQSDSNQQNWTYSSDHGPFHRAGIPFLYFGVEDHEDYHQPTDDVSKITPQFLENTVKSILEVAIKIDQQ
ncbi:MAG: M20/M25/M40 family metallo-hydrolase [Bacteroidota bacterium]